MVWSVISRLDSQASLSGSLCQLQRSLSRFILGVEQRWYAPDSISYNVVFPCLDAHLLRCARQVLKATRYHCAITNTSRQSLVPRCSWLMLYTRAEIHSVQTSRHSCMHTCNTWLLYEPVRHGSRAGKECSVFPAHICMPHAGPGDNHHNPILAVLRDCRSFAYPAASIVRSDPAQPRHCLTNQQSSSYGM